MAELASRQHGVVARRQLAPLGVSETMVRDRLRASRLVRLHRGVYAVGHAQLRPEGRWLAAVLAAGPGATLSHRSAAALHGIRESRGAIDVATTRRVAVRGVLIHRTTVLTDADVTTHRGVPVTTLARTFLDLAGILTAEQLGKLVRETDRAGRLDARVVQTRIDGRRDAGAKALRATLAEHARLATSLTLSELEDRFLALLDAHELPRPLTNHLVLGMKVDAVWPEQRLAVELDSWTYHRDRAAFEEDRARDARLAVAGWTHARFTHAQVVERPAQVVATLRNLLAL